MNLERYAHAADNHPGPPHQVNGRIRYLLALILITVGCLTASDGYSKSESAQYKEYEVKAAFIYNFLKFVEWPKEKQTFSPGEITIGILGQDPFGAAFDAFKDKQVKDSNVVVRYFDSYQKLKDAVEKDKAELYQKIEALRKGYLIFKDEKGNILIKPVEDFSELKDETDTGRRQQKIEELKKRGLLFVDPAKEENLKVIVNALVQEKIEALKKCHVLFICTSEKEYVSDIIKLVKDRSVLTAADMDGFLEAGGVANFVMEDNKIHFQINAVAADRAKLAIRSQLLRLAQKVVKQEAASETLHQEKN